MFAERLAWLIPILPLAAFVAIVFLSAAGMLNQTNRRRASQLAIGAMGAAWLIAWGIVAQVIATRGFTRFDISFPWLPIGGGVLAMGVMVDALTAALLFMVYDGNKVGNRQPSFHTEKTSSGWEKVRNKVGNWRLFASQRGFRLGIKLETGIE